MKRTEKVVAANRLSKPHLPNYYNVSVRDVEALESTKNQGKA